MRTPTVPIRERDVVATDGTALRLRSIRPADAPALVAFHNRLSSETTYYRFFSFHPRLSEREVDWFTHVDDHDRVALVALDGDRIVAVGRYDRIRGTAGAEVAFVVEDAYQRRGICTLLIRELTRAGIEEGIERFVAHVLPGNHRMLGALRRCGLETSSHMAGDEIEVILQLDAGTERGGGPWQ